MTAGLNFDGICNAIQTCGSSSQQSATGFLAVPPDTNGAVGATQFVQWVNYAFAVFDKATGAMAKHFPKPGNALWYKFGGPCETNNSGDPIAQYDKLAGRWVMMQPVFTKPYTICIAVSTSSDATGTYYRYAFTPTTYFPDYPKLGIWVDGYYISIDLYTGQGFGGKFKGVMICALDRTNMLVGAAASAICPPQLSPDFPHLLPSDFDGMTTTQPPRGSPNYFLNLGNDLMSLNLWAFHPNFADGTWTLTGPMNIPVMSFSEACGGGICIPQAGTNRLLDSLGDRPMYRLAYRNFGDHETLVVSHSVTAGSSTGARWYEILNPGSCSPDPTSNQYCIFQQGTFAPDANFRWMGSIAMDKVGNIAVGFSKSSVTVHPSIYFTGRVPGDPLGTLEGEARIIDGTGSQTNASNWGDYSSMSVDPVDDCTFWYTTEYFKTNSNENWSTRIASFKFPSCPTPSP